MSQSHQRPTTSTPILYARVRFSRGDPSRGPYLYIGIHNGITVVPCRSCLGLQAEIEQKMDAEIDVALSTLARPDGTMCYIAHQPETETPPPQGMERFSSGPKLCLGDTHQADVVFLGGIGAAGSSSSAVLIKDGQALMIDCGLSLYAKRLEEQARKPVDYSQYLASVADDLEEPEDERADTEMFPNFDLLEEIFLGGTKLAGILVTHGHLDHYGALPEFFRRFNPFCFVDGRVRIYGHRFTTSLVHQALITRAFEGESRPFQTEALSSDKSVEIGPFRVTPFDVFHAVHGSYGYALETGATPGSIVFSGDLKARADKPEEDLIRTWETFRRINQEHGPVRLLVLDGTNARVPGLTNLETNVTAGLREIIANAPGRTIITFFSTRFDRMMTTRGICWSLGKTLSMWGASFIPVIEAGTAAGLSMPNISVGNARADVVIVTGCQANPGSVAERLSRSERVSGISVNPQDTIILSAQPIPGNVRAVRTMVKGFEEQGATVYIDHAFPGPDPMYHSRRGRTHVSGHGFAEDIAWIIAACQPERLLPYHTGPEAMLAMADIATYKLQVPMPSEQILLPGRSSVTISY